MQQRHGRPSGTDGSDFSYRMVVDSRYQRVAEGRSCLARIILVQMLHQVAGGVLLLLSLSKGTEINKFAVLSVAAGLLAILLGGIRAEADYGSASSVVHELVINSCCILHDMHYSFRVVREDLEAEHISHYKLRTV